MALPTSDLWINVKANSFVGLNGSGEATGWGDLSTGGTSHDLTAEAGREADFLATEPAVNGMPVVFKKSGKNSWLRTASFAVFPDVTDITLYMVIKSITSSSILDRYIDTGVDSLVVSGNSSFLKVTYKGQSIQISADFTTYRLVRFTTSAAGSTIAVDSTLITSNTLSQTPGLTSDRLSIFSSAVGANTGNKSFAEIALFTALHGSSDISDSESYFRTEYGLSPAVLTTPVITFPAIPLKGTTDADFAPGATSNSPAQVTYVSSNTAVATIISGQVHIVGVGTANITASQVAAIGYNAPTSVSQTLTVSTQAVISFPILPTKTAGDADFSPGATSNSTAPINYFSSDPSVAIIVGTTIHIVGAGATTITAYQGSAVGYTAATNVSRTFTVNPFVAVSSGPKPPGGMVFLDGIDLWLTYGIIIEKGSADFLRFPPKKESISHDWIDANGVDVDLTAIFFTSREVSLSCGILAADENTYWLNHNKFITQLMKPGKHRLELTAHQGRQYYVYYKEVNNYDQVEPVKGIDGAHLVGHKFTLVLVEPEPTINHVATAISDDNGRVIIT